MSKEITEAACRLEKLVPDSPLTGALAWLDETDSTNDEVKRRAALSCSEGLTVFADSQTAGRGRLGRSFSSAAGKGLYFSVLLCPRCTPERCAVLTAWAAVAVCDTLEKYCGISVKIKWPNDIVFGGKKLCGILTELLTSPEGGLRGVVLGIGLNVSQTPGDFGAEFADRAISLGQIMSAVPPRIELAAALLRELDGMRTAFPHEGRLWLARYRELCLTVGSRVLAGGREGTAEAVDEDFSLLVRFDGGALERVFFGEVSVRGLYGYV